MLMNMSSLRYQEVEENSYHKGRPTAYNTVYAVRFAHPNAFGTSQTRKPLGEILKKIRSGGGKKWEID